MHGSGPEKDQKHDHPRRQQCPTQYPGLERTWFAFRRFKGRSAYLRGRVGVSLVVVAHDVIVIWLDQSRQVFSYVAS